MYPDPLVRTIRTNVEEATRTNEGVAQNFARSAPIEQDSMLREVLWTYFDHIGIMIGIVHNLIATGGDHG